LLEQESKSKRWILVQKLPVFPPGGLNRLHPSVFYDKLPFMSNVYQVYMGIDVGLGAHPVTFVTLDAGQQVMAIGEGDVHDALAFAAGQTGGALVAINAAAHPNQGRMSRAEIRKALNPPPARGKFTALRQVEYEIIQAGMDLPETPSSAEKSLPWVRRGFQLVEKLETVGYKPFAEEDSPQEHERRWLEVNADAAIGSLLGVRPLESGTLEGRIQRQIVLRDEGLNVPDAMDFFEEITRYKILKSNLPTKNIFPQAEINAWIAAHTAWLAANEPGRIRRFGEAEEGYIYLPCLTD
jgi:hypothetical protein